MESLNSKLANNPQERKENDMPKKFSEEDAKLAKEFLARAKNYDSNKYSFPARIGFVARDLGYSGYNDDTLAGVRSAISYFSNLAKQKIKESGVKETIPSQEELWFEELLRDPNMQHAFLHPEDDEDKINDINKYGEK